METLPERSAYMAATSPLLSSLKIPDHTGEGFSLAGTLCGPFDPLNNRPGETAPCAGSSWPELGWEKPHVTLVSLALVQRSWNQKSTALYPILSGPCSLRHPKRERVIGSLHGSSDCSSLNVIRPHKPVGSGTKSVGVALLK